MQEDANPAETTLRELKARPEPQKCTSISANEEIVPKAQQLSPFESYQMAVPQIIKSNARVQQLVSIESEKQKVPLSKLNTVHYFLTPFI